MGYPGLVNKSRNGSRNTAESKDQTSVEGLDASGFVPSGESEQALLAAGKISVEEFMDMSVDRALMHLKGEISDSRLGLMRELLRTQLEQDPTLSALVSRVAQGD
jgi:hypothetical protein